MGEQIDAVPLCGHGVCARLVLHIVRDDDITAAASRLTGLLYHHFRNRLDVAGEGRARDRLDDLGERCVVGVHLDTERAQVKFPRGRGQESR
ncbi:MAG: hypothetical protein ACRDQ4_01750 [Pseudonocardiaceae bacterium]